jgi:hypothetical protein
MDEIISYKMCAVKVRNAKLRNYLNCCTRYHKIITFHPVKLSDDLPIDLMHNDVTRLDARDECWS